MNNPLHLPDEESEFSDLESIIYRAQHYVVPSDDLRPRTLEAAKEQHNQVVTIWYLSCATAFGFALWSLLIACIPSVERSRKAMTAPFQTKCISSLLK